IENETNAQRHYIIRLTWRREKPEQRDDEVDAKIWLEIRMRLAATCRPEAPCSHGNWRRRVNIFKISQSLADHVVSRVDVRGGGFRTQESVVVRRYLLRRERYLLCTTGLRQYEPVAHVNGYPPTQIREGERRLPIAAIGRADQIK